MFESTKERQKIVVVGAVADSVVVSAVVVDLVVVVGAGVASSFTCTIRRPCDTRSDSRVM